MKTPYHATPRANLDRLPPVLWEKITKRGSKVTIKNNIVHITTWTHEDTFDITNLLNAYGIDYDMFQTEKTLGRGWEVSFMFSDLISRMGRKQLT